MKNTVLLTISIVIFCCSASSANLFGQSVADTYVNNEIIVKLAQPSDLPAIAHQYGLHAMPLAQIGDRPIYRLRVPNGIPLDQLDARYTSGIVIRISETEHPADVLQRVREVLRTYPGSGELQFCFYLENGSRVFLKAHATKVSITRELRDRLDDLLGPGNLQLITTPPRPAQGSRPHRPPYQKAGAR